MNTHGPSLVLVVLLSTMAVVRAPATEKPPALTVEDKIYLDDLVKEFLFDPKGAERVVVKTVLRTAWGSSRATTAEGWWVAGKDGEPGRIYFTDGASILAPPEKEIVRVDFRAACKARYAAATKKNDAVAMDEIFSKMQQAAVGALGTDDLALAAWLRCLGDEGLAAQALAAARKEEGDLRRRLRDQLAWSAYTRMVHAYMVRADEEALAHSERLLRLYPDEIKGKEFHQATQIVEELRNGGGMTRTWHGVGTLIPPDFAREG